MGTLRIILAPNDVEWPEIFRVISYFSHLERVWYFLRVNSEISSCGLQLINTLAWNVIQMTKTTKCCRICNQWSLLLCFHSNQQRLYARTTEEISVQRSLFYVTFSFLIFFSNIFHNGNIHFINCFFTSVPPYKNPMELFQIRVLKQLCVHKNVLI